MLNSNPFAHYMLLSSLYEVLYYVLCFLRHSTTLRTLITYIHKRCEQKHNDDDGAEERKES